MRISNIKTTSIEDRHERLTFSCGNHVVDSFLHDRSNVRLHRSYDHRIHVVLGEDQVSILGYYCLQIVTFRYKKRQLPDIELKMIGVLTSFQRQGIGTALIVDAFHKVIQIADAVGIKNLFIEAADEDSYNLYESIGFTVLEASNKYKMYISIETIYEAITIYENIAS